MLLTVHHLHLWLSKLQPLHVFVFVGCASDINLNDPGTYMATLILTSKIVDISIANGPSQLNSNFKLLCDETGRKFSCGYYNKSLVNGETVKRV